MKHFSPFDPRILSKISSLSIRAKTVAHGVLSGIHKSHYKGSSIEFLEHKEYSPGDEIKHMDWKLFARSDKHYIKQFENETNMNISFVIDASGSMGYKSDAISKLEYGATLVASLAYLFVKQSDAIGFFSSTEKGANYIPPRANLTHFNYIIDVLEKLVPNGKTNITDTLALFSEKIKKRSTIIVVSDFFDDTDNVIKYLRQYRYRKDEVILFHVLDPFELEFPFEKPMHFLSMEDERELFVYPKAIKDSYIARINRFVRKFRQGCISNGIEHCLVNSSVPVDTTIIKFLADRSNKEK